MDRRGILEFLESSERLSFFPLLLLYIYKIYKKAKAIRNQLSAQVVKRNYILLTELKIDIGCKTLDSKIYAIV